MNTSTMTRQTTVSRIRVRSQGQAVLEMALVLPVFILVIMGIYDFAVSLHIWSSLNQAAIAGAREGAKRVTSLYPVYRYKRDANVVKNALKGSLSPMVNQSSFVSGYDPRVTAVTNASGTPIRLNVAVRYNHRLITPLLNGLVGGANGNGNVVLSAEASEDLN